MVTIHKFILEVQHSKKVIAHLPEGSVIKTVAFQGRNLCVWAIVDTDKSMVQRNFKIFTTGEEITERERLMFIHTIVDMDYVFHLFEEVK